MHLRFLMAMVLLLIAASFKAESSPISPDQLQKKWQEFKAEFGKIYKDKLDEEKRKNIFKQSLINVIKHNEQYAKGLESYEMGINEFSDMDDSERMALLSDFSFEDTPGTKKSPSRRMPTIFQTPPKILNYTELGYVTPVKSQGRFGTCYAFSATGALEGQIWKKKKSLESLSEQQIVDCCTKLNNGGIEFVYEYIASAGGLQSSTDYPYRGKKEKCKHNKAKSVGKCKHFQSYRDLTETKLRSILAEVGPLSVVIDASPTEFKSYKAGIFNNKKCDQKIVNHAVLLVGYDETDTKKPYWIIKNSHGTTWGMKGYMHMAMYKNMCGIATKVAYPIV